jgi:hypothetical protein
MPVPTRGLFPLECVPARRRVHLTGAPIPGSGITTVHLLGEKLRFLAVMPAIPTTLCRGPSTELGHRRGVYGEHGWTHVPVLQPELCVSITAVRNRVLQGGENPYSCRSRVTVPVFGNNSCMLLLPSDSCPEHGHRGQYADLIWCRDSPTGHLADALLDARQCTL